MHITWVHKVKTRGFPGFPENLGFLGSKPEPKQALVYARTLLYNYRQLGRPGTVQYDRIKVPYSTDLARRNGVIKKCLTRLQLRKELTFRIITRKRKLHEDLFYVKRAADFALRSRINYTVSGFRRVLFFFHKSLRRNLSRTRQLLQHPPRHLSHTQRPET